MANPKKIRVPRFKDLEEERKFWDEADLTDLAEGELQATERAIVRPAGALSAQLAIRLDARSMAELRQRADELGVGPTQLARAWIIEKLERKHDQPESLYADPMFEEAVLEVISRHADQLELSGAEQRSGGSPRRVSNSAARKASRSARTGKVAAKKSSQKVASGKKSTRGRRS